MTDHEAHLSPTAIDVKNFIRNGAYAWPGGYPIYFVTVEGDTLSYEAVKAHACDVLRGTLGYRGADRSWNIAGVEVNWENPDLYCAETSRRIPSAYAEDDAND